MPLKQKMALTKPMMIELPSLTSVDNDFIAPAGQKDGATGVTTNHQGVLYL